MSRIERVTGRQIWGGSGLPALEVEIGLADGAMGFASAPTTVRPVVGLPFELRDGGRAFGGQGVSRALKVIASEVEATLRGLDAGDQETIDRVLIGLDGTSDRQRLGRNVTLACSIAAARAEANSLKLPLWRHVGARWPSATVPMPVIELLGSGDASTGDGLLLASIQIVPVGAEDLASALDWCAEVLREVGQQVRQVRSLMGGLLNPFDTAEDALTFAVRCIERAGFTAGEDIGFVLDVNSSVVAAQGGYVLAREGQRLDAAALMARQLDWLARFPVLGLIDPLGREDAAAWPVLARAAGKGVLTIGRDVLTSDPRRIDGAAEAGACTGLAIDLCHCSTLTEMKVALASAQRAGWTALLAQSSIEGSQTWLSHLAVGFDIGLMQGGLRDAAAAGQWNEALRIGGSLPGGGRLPQAARFGW